MRIVGRLLVVVLVGVLALALGYATTRAVVGSDAEPVPPIDLDNPPILDTPAETTEPNTGATVVPPPTLPAGPPVTAAVPPPPTTPAPPTPPPDDDDDGDDGGDDGDD